ncbi:3 beta-hydroxysteroid dehydrogenase type 7-like [Bombina bombina]|uniref:3 beta-hydroxysteroid dehydrogenase type 7-like n=1 Tax=Bombina bombina TaxID=8345 RepID=UPI00235A768A|nr:3 beta-hydroxysteroid dehydrogenase type 7-like [Bombina bombina]
MAKDMVYLVTGGCGYIGEHIVKILAKEDYIKEVRIFDVVEVDSIKSFSTDSTTVRLIKGDITDYNQLQKAMEGVDVVIHTAALVDYLDTLPFHKMEAINVGGTKNVLKACISMDVRYIVYTSSVAAVGPNSNYEPMLRGTEDTMYNGKTELSYGKTKACAENIIRQAKGTQTRNGKLLVTCAIRPSNIYGEKSVTVLESYLSAKSKNGLITCIEPKNVDHNYTYVGNVAWMHVLAARNLQLKPAILGGQVYYAYDDTPMRHRSDLYTALYSEIDPRMTETKHVPYWKMWLIVHIYSIIKFLVSPFCSLKPFVTPPVLKLIFTTFSYETDKAFRHFEYRPLFSWLESKRKTCEWLKQATENLQNNHKNHKQK